MCLIHFLIIFLLVAPAAFGESYKCTWKQVSGHGKVNIHAGYVELSHTGTANSRELEVCRNSGSYPDGDVVCRLETEYYAEYRGIAQLFWDDFQLTSPIFLERIMEYRGNPDLNHIPSASKCFSEGPWMVCFGLMFQSLSISLKLPNKPSKVEGVCKEQV